MYNRTSQEPAYERRVSSIDQRICMPECLTTLNAGLLPSIGPPGPPSAQQPTILTAVTEASDEERIRLSPRAPPHITLVLHTYLASWPGGTWGNQGGEGARGRGAGTGKTNDACKGGREAYSYSTSIRLRHLQLGWLSGLSTLRLLSSRRTGSTGLAITRQSHVLSKR